MVLTLHEASQASMPFHMTKKTATPSPYMTRTETAEYIGVTPRGVNLMTADGRLTAYTLGSRVVRFRRDEIDAAFTPANGQLVETRAARKNGDSE